MPLSEQDVHIVNSGPSQHLAGLRVIELSQILTGAYCGMLLADMGADVIKIERPAGGDPTRRYGPPFVDEDAYYYWSVNRNKRGISLDLKQPQDRTVLRQLAERSDVLLHNYLPAQATALGFSYEQLADDKSRLIYCSITGFDTTGPIADKSSLDIVLQAVTGAMSITGEADRPPVRSPIPVADLSAALHAATAILAAVIRREGTGMGEKIEVSLAQSIGALMPYHWGDVFLAGGMAERLGNGHPTIVPYNCYAAKDGYIVLTANSDESWQNLCRALQADSLLSSPDLRTNAGRVANRQIVDAQIQEKIAQHPCKVITERLDRHNIPSGKVNSLSEAAPLLRTWQLQSDTRGIEVPVMAPPYRFSSEAAPRMKRPPRLGEHTQEVLEELKLAPARAPLSRPTEGDVPTGRRRVRESG